MVAKIKKCFKYSFVFKMIDKIENWIYQRKLLNNSFSLLTPNCMGGLIYHRLGVRFNSPTIDISMPTHDFMLLINNLDYYLSNDIYETESCFSYPVGVINGNENLDDITINFVHYDSFEYAREKWNQRKTRIDKDNLYIIVCDLDDIYTDDIAKAGFISDEDLLLFESIKCNNKAMLTRDKSRNQEYAYYIEPRYGKPFPLTYMNRDILGLNVFEKHFDFVSFINKGAK